ncbi:MAG: ATP-binding cassette domain-containing protein [Candidatus Scatosoma sp.]
MLEVVHLSKIYKTKGGVETKALNDVSVRFPEKGLVFLLGKSGSGKSTLLNVCGGLDSPTSGEIIVKGRSSKNFSQSDFDSYRNTFIGFVFQEYNILNEFTVEDNIALALELQGKPKDKKAIKALLDEVELGAYARRKPNTLSGGQKQRIAIARALIKQPEIIMADEPTGALDSATGKQVFDTLKKLSQKKLVIVVSHDRDSAEEYADRIIELKDGKIISDVSKEAAAAQPLGENLSVIGENTLSVKNGATLTEQDYRYIYAFLSNHQGAMITSGEKEIADFKKASHITEEGGKEFFADTDEKKIPKKKYDPKKTQFIRSKLPLRHAFKIGVSGLKSKPFRLIFTVLLCSVAFIMFGLFSTLTFYDKNETLYQTLDDSGVTVLHVDKRYKTTTVNTYTNGNGETETNSYDGAMHTRMTEEEVQKIASTFGAETFGVTALSKSYETDISYGGYNVNPVSIENVNLSSSTGRYYVAELCYAGYLPESHPFRTNRLKAGAYPAADDEIMISSYTASVLVAASYQGVTDEAQLIGKSISFRISDTPASAFKISGIFNSGDNVLAQKYGKYTEAVQINGNDETRKELNSLSAELTDGYHQIAFFTEKTANDIRNATKISLLEKERLYNRRAALFEESGESGYYNSFYFVKSSSLEEPEKTVWLNGKTNVSNGEAVVSLSTLGNILERYYSYDSELSNNIYYDIINGGYFVDSSWLVEEWLNNRSVPQDDASADSKNAYQKFLQLTQDGGKFEQQANQYKFFNLAYKIPSVTDAVENNSFYWLYCAAQGRVDYYTETEGNVTLSLSAEQIKFIAQTVLEKTTAAFGSNISFDARAIVPNYEGDRPTGEKKSFSVSGVYLGTISDTFFVSDSDYSVLAQIIDDNTDNYFYSSMTTTEYVSSNNSLYDAVFFPYSSAQRKNLSLFSYEFGEDHARIAIGNTAALELDIVNSMVEEMSKVFMWIGIVLAAFSMLLLSSFIATSISYKKKEIGILRAVGARGADVFKIFFSEASVIAAICFALGIAGSIFGCRLLNNELADTLNASIFVFGGASIAILLGIAVVTSAIATFLPVFSAARKKPVEAIRAL